MNYEEFVGHVVSCMENCFEQKKTVQVKKVLKNNDIELDGLVITKDENGVVPTIYLNEYYDDYVNGRDINSIEEEIYYIYDNHYDAVEFDIEKFMDFEKIKGRILYKLISRKTNERFLLKVPYIPYLDFAIIFYYMLESSDDGNAITVIHTEHMKMWGKTPEDLLQVARINTPNIMPIQINSMEEVIRELANNKDISLNNGEGPSMYVMTNEQKFFGASTLLYEGVLEAFAKKMKRDIYILPSSVHEVILVPDEEGIEKEALSELVRSVNANELTESDILSDHAYIYRIDTGLLCE